MNKTITKIPVKQYSTVYTSSELNEWECQHENTRSESFTTDYMTFDGPDQFDTEIIVCADCNMWHNLGEEDWQV